MASSTIIARYLLRGYYLMWLYCLLSASLVLFSTICNQQIKGKPLAMVVLNGKVFPIVRG